LSCSNVFLLPLWIFVGIVLSFDNFVQIDAPLGPRVLLFRCSE
jgi:hypothetical protein